MRTTRWLHDHGTMTQLLAGAACLLLASTAYAEVPAEHDAVDDDAAEVDATVPGAEPAPDLPHGDGDHDATETPGPHPVTPTDGSSGATTGYGVHEVAPPPDEPSAGPIYERGGLFGLGLNLALKVGGGFSQPFNAFGSAFVPELEVGATLPFAKRAIEVFFSGQWAAPGAEGTAGPDDRLPGDGMMAYEVTQQTVALTLGLRFRLPIPGDLFRPHLALGGRAYLMRTEVSGSSGGEPFGDNEETGTSFGFFGAVGGELFVGPGALLLEIQVGYAALDATIMRNTNVGSLTALLGYRFFF